MLSADQTSEKDFERLLAWLEPDREKAAEKYERIRRNLVGYFRRQGTEDPDALADEVFVRVTLKVNEIVPTFVGEPGNYFFGVARNVLAEWRRRPAQIELIRDIPVFTDPEAVDTKELLLQSMEQCWAKLSPKEQIILMRYYLETATRKISEGREELASELGVSINALRVTAHRIRGKLRRCIEKLANRNNLK